jgi:hypothetical protein
MSVKVGEVDMGKNVMIELGGDISFTADAIGKPKFLFWLNLDQADKLLFQLGASLEDYQRSKESQKKAGQK